MIHLNIALLLMASTFVLGWLFEGMWSTAARIVNDASSYRDLRTHEELMLIEEAELAAQRARDDEQLRKLNDW